MPTTFQDIYRGKKVLITGHTGFKGAWLSFWLKELGAEVIGYAHPPEKEDSFFASVSLENHIEHILGDVRDSERLEECFLQYQPEMVFHLASQALVLQSYEIPHETFETNVMGTVNLLEAVRKTPSVKACVVVTSDKCYENRDWIWGYREEDPLGASDPYSTSKVMVEFLVNSYQHSFFSLGKGKALPVLATARAGNVIGGGDFSDFRLMCDSYRALSNQEPIILRQPFSSRPWLFVLDALSGYLALGKNLLLYGKPYQGSWNFAPIDEEIITAEAFVETVIRKWGHGTWTTPNLLESDKEKKTLTLNGEKTRKLLNWKATYSFEETIDKTVSWYKEYKEKGEAGADMSLASLDLLSEYVRRAKESGQSWASRDVPFLISAFSAMT